MSRRKWSSPSIVARSTAGTARSWITLFAGAALLVSCSRSPVPQTPGHGSAPILEVLPLSQMDLGASLLAQVENARFAIGLQDPVAASNDVSQALSFAEQLSSRPSKLIHTGPTNGGDGRSAQSSGPGSYPAPLTDFGVIVDLTSVQAELAGNLPAADADLQKIQSRIPPGLIPTNLPLLRAAASLELARIDAAMGQTLALKTQLLCAQSALRSFTEPDHMAEARALAETIGQSLAQSETVKTMLPYRVDPWLSKVVEWGHSDRWIMPII